MKLGLIATVRETPGILIRAQATVAAATDVVVDCSETEHCDVAALQVLLALRAELERHGRSLHLTGVSSKIAWRFELVGLASASDDEPATPVVE